jgi:Metallo-beta-lactamase superfamily
MVRIRGRPGWRFSDPNSGGADPGGRCYLRGVKRLHRPDLWGWSRFDEGRNIDFHSVLRVHPDGNVAIDPLPLSPHDKTHLESLGGVATIVITNSDHVRAAAELASATGARVLGPAGERDRFPIPCDGTLADGDRVADDLIAIALHGSKTPGELALILSATTLITGDLVRAHRGGGLDCLPDSKLADRAAALASLRRLAELPGIDAVLVGDGWPMFSGGGRALRELCAAVESRAAT